MRNVYYTDRQQRISIDIEIMTLHKISFGGFIHYFMFPWLYLGTVYQTMSNSLHYRKTAAQTDSFDLMKMNNLTSNVNQPELSNTNKITKVIGITRYTVFILKKSSGSNAVSYIHHIWLYTLAIKRSGAIEDNRGPKINSCERLPIFHSKLNSTSGHNFIKLSFLRVYISINKIDIICFSETYLGPSISAENEHLVLPEFNLVRADHPTNKRRGGVCIYFHNALPLKVIEIELLNECINFEIRISGKLRSFLCLYRSSSQTQDIFARLADNF